MRLTIALAIWLGISAAAPASAQEQVSTAPADAWLSTVGLVANGEAGLTCSGVLVRADVVATAAHCIEQADARDLQFAPVLGADVWRGTEIIAAGGFEGGPKINPARVKTDWALVRIGHGAADPVPVAGLRQWEIRRAVEAGARVAAIGVDRKGKLHAYIDCPLLGEHGDFFFKLRCPVVPGDSGGPVFLMAPEAQGGVQLVGLIVGYLDGETIVVNARRFAPWLDGIEPLETRALIASQPTE